MLPYVKNSDTSKAAAVAAVKSSEPMKEDILFLIRKRPVTGFTCDEVETKTGGPHQTVSARVRDLVKEGRIKDSGQRRPTRRGRAARVYVGV